MAISVVSLPLIFLKEDWWLISCNCIVKGSNEMTGMQLFVQRMCDMLYVAQRLKSLVMWIINKSDGGTFWLAGCSVLLLVILVY